MPSNTELETSVEPGSYSVPTPPENSDHGYLVEDNRIPTIYSCAEWAEFWDELGPAISFEAANNLPDYKIAVSTEIFLKNRHLDSDGDGVICLLEAGVPPGSESQLGAAPSQVGTQEPLTILTPVEELSSIQECKVIQGGKFSNQTVRAGFPSHPDYQFEADSQIVIQLVFVETEDMPSLGASHLDTQFILSAETFLEDVTEGKFDFDFRTPNSVATLPRNISEYGLVRSGSVLLYEFIQDSISASDGFIDFSDVDIVVAVPPANASAEQVAFSPALPLEKSSAFATQEGNVYRATLVGQDMRWDEGHLLLTHEIGHLLGLQDYYSFEWQEGDDYPDQFKFLGEFDNMNSAAGKAREWLGWSRFLLGVLDEDQVRCVTDQSDTFHKLVAIGSPETGSKITVIPTGPYTAVVVESRKSMRHDSLLPDYLSGLLVYQVNTEKESGYGPVAIVRKESLRSPFLLDAPLRVGESVEVDGLVIRNVESSPTWDVVQVAQN